MRITRRGLALGGAGLALGTAASGRLAAPALAQSGPIRIGWLAALTGPSSAPAIGFDRGVKLALERINGSGGVGGRQIELVVRDTQGDPTKAVNAAQEMISRARVHAIYGPTNSGESLAVTPIMARPKMPNIHPCFVDTLIDPQRYPNAFRMAPSNSQIDRAVSAYGVDVLKLSKFAVVGDTTGYGTTTVASSSGEFERRGAQVVYRGTIDATQPDLTPDMLRMRNAGAEAITVWTVSPGLISRIMNTRANMGWDVPLIGHPAMGSGEVGQLLAKPENWRKVYILGFKNCSYNADGKLAPQTQAWVDANRNRVNLEDTTLWWVVSGVDAIDLIAKAIQESGGTDNNGIINYWNSVQAYPGLFANYSWTPQDHNGVPQEELVMSEANSLSHGAYRLAPGYA